MALKLQSIYNDPDHYVKSFTVFISLCGKFSGLTYWMENVFGEAVVAKVRTEMKEQDDLRILGIGSGSGEVDVTMLTKLLQRFPHVNNRVVEPAVDHLVMYKALVQTKAHQLQGVVCDWRQQTIDQYEKAGDTTKFHFISAVHSIYYAENVDSSLMYLYDHLEAGGVMLVVTISDESGSWRLVNRFPDHLNVTLSSAEVRSCFDRHNVAYTQYHQASHVDITQCFDETSEDGRLVVDFLTHILKFKETAPADLQREVMEYLASSDCSEKMSDGRVLFNNQLDAVVVQKMKE